MSIERSEGIGLESVRKNKEEVFSFVSDYSASNYKFFKEKFSVIENQPDFNEQARQLLSLWEDDLFMASEKNTSEYKLPGIAAVQVFEYSMNLLGKPIDADLKKEIANKQVQLLIDSREQEELYNNLVGIWGYYVSPDAILSVPDIDNKKELLKEYYTVRNSLQSAAEKLIVEETSTAKPDSQKLWYLTISAKGSLRYDDQDKTDKIRYFSSLYNEDKMAFQDEAALSKYVPEYPPKPVTATAPEAEEIRVEDGGLVGGDNNQPDIGELDPGAASENEAGQGISPFEEEQEPASTEPTESGLEVEKGEPGLHKGERMPEHIRFFSFEADRLPTPEKVAAGRVRFYISEDSRVLTDPDKPKSTVPGSVKEVITADRLPAMLMTRYINRMLGTRGIENYKKARSQKDATGESRRIREKAVRDFIADLFDFESALWLELRGELESDPELVNKLQNLLSTYDKNKVYLVTAISINPKVENNKGGDSRTATA
jgi:hypothetical protein